MPNRDPLIVEQRLSKLTATQRALYDSTPPSFRFPLQPKQQKLRELMNSSHVTDIGYGGARGGGKSHGARDIILMRRLEFPGTTGVIFRRTFKDLNDNHIEPLFRQRPDMRQWYKQDVTSLYCPNGSVLKFRYYEHPGEVRAELGKEYMDILVEEAGQWIEDDLTFLRTCRRAPGYQDYQCKTLYTFNWGGVGHNYLKRVFWDKNYKDKERSEDFEFIHAFGWDNWEWVRPHFEPLGIFARDYYAWTDERRFQEFVTKSQYGRTLDILPEHDRKKFLLGVADDFEGQVFGELCELHNLDNYVRTGSEVAFSQYMKKQGGLDHASTGITAYVETCLDWDDNIYAIEEYYQADRRISEHVAGWDKITDIGPQRVLGIREIREKYRDTNMPIIDPSTEAKTLQNKDEMFSVQDAYNREGINTRSAFRTLISVGIDLLHEYLRIDPLRLNPFTQERGSPKLFISKSRCPNLWQEMSGLQIIKNIRTGVMEYKGADHALDDLRYIVLDRNPAPAKPVPAENLAPQVQFVVRTHDNWKKDFDQAVANKQGQGKTYW